MPIGTTKRQVMNGTAIYTSGGLTKENIKTIKRDGYKHYVSKKKSELAKRNLGPWNEAVSKAKIDLGIPKNEFVLLRKSSQLYKRAAEIYYD
jgi:hypothetical protein